MISSKKIVPGGFLEKWQLAPADSGTLSYQVIIYLGFWLQTKRALSVSALLWLFLVRCLLPVWQTFADSWWLHMNGVVLNWICYEGETPCWGMRGIWCRFWHPFPSKKQNYKIAASFQQQQLLNLHCIEVKCLSGVVHYILQYETLTFHMKGIYFI